MMISDPVGDMITRIRNAALVQKKIVELPANSLKLAVAELLRREGYLTSVEKVGNTIRLELAYEDKEPKVTGLKRISKPGLRWYVGSKKIPVVMGGAGLSVLSTPQGVMSGKEAKKKGIGGEVLCEVW